MPAWMVLQNPESIYNDVEAECYEYPRSIPNGNRIAQGDYLICTLSKKNSKNGKRIFGIGRISSIEQYSRDGKIMRRANYDWYRPFPEPKTFEFIGGDPRNNIYNAMNAIPQDRASEVISLLVEEFSDDTVVMERESNFGTESEPRSVQTANSDVRLQVAAEIDPSGPGPFGRWLEAELSAKTMNPWDLAQRSDILVHHIEQILRGDIRHPMPAVMKSIQESLDEEVDTITRDAIRQDSEIEGFGDFCDFDPHGDQSLWPTGSGVYVFYDISSRPVYVGETSDLHRRMKQYFSPQRRMWWVSQPIVETASFIPVEETQLRKRLEKILIRFLKSNAVMNRTHVRR